MNLNANSRFSVAPSIDIQRSRFDRSFQHKTTFNAGELIPVYCSEVLPGDTVEMDLSTLIRMNTPIFPTMDNCVADVYFFFVPNRLVWDHWREFMGENTQSYWTPQTEYQVPQIISPPETGFDKGSIADYFGWPTNVPYVFGSALPFRAYVLCWNEWFRDQNTMMPAYINKGDSNSNGSTRALNEQEIAETNGINYLYAVDGGMPLPVCRFHDYFASSLPQPQKGEALDIPLFQGNVPVTTSAVPHNLADYPIEVESNLVSSGGNYPLYARSGNVNGLSQAVMAFNTTSETPSGNWGNFIPSNLEVNLQNVAAGTIMQLRQAFQIQKLLERDARSGTRYREILQGHFGTAPTDARMQVPEYLGGKRIPINIDQVLQTSETTETSPQGNTAAFSLTTDVSSMFTKSFTEHGLLLCLCAIRNYSSYQQGLSRMWTRSRRYDFYWPELANLSEQPIYRQEIFATEGAGGYDMNDSNYDVFGYQEAWADYRYEPSRVSGALRSNYAQTLDSWHYADYYEGDPEKFVLQDGWMKSPAKENIDRTLAVQSSVEDQFTADFYFKAVWTRPMPMFSIPGLADHH